MEKEEIILRIAHELSRIESFLRVQKAEASTKKDLAVIEWDKALEKDIHECFDKWSKAPKDAPLIKGGQSKEERDCFFKWVKTENKDERLTSIIFAVNFLKRKFSNIQPDKEHLKETLPFLNQLISELDNEKNKGWRLQQQIAVLKIGESMLRQQTLLR